jgi:hypothetical protein
MPSDPHATAAALRWRAIQRDDIALEHVLAGLRHRTLGQLHLAEAADRLVLASLTEARDLRATAEDLMGEIDETKEQQ